MALVTLPFVRKMRVPYPVGAGGAEGDDKVEPAKSDPKEVCTHVKKAREDNTRPYCFENLIVNCRKE